MADPLEQRIAIIEASMGGKTLQEHFREHAELLDRRFMEIYGKLTNHDSRFDAIDGRFRRIDLDLRAMRCDIRLILAKLSAM